MMPTPPRLLAWLLQRLTSAHAADAVVGDALEEFTDRQDAGRAPRWAGLWLSLRLIGAIAGATATAFPRLLRAVELTIRDAVRAIRAAPGHSLFVVMVLGTGITLATVTFSVVDAVILKPLPIEHSERVVGITTWDQAARRGRVTADGFWQLHDHLQSVESVAAWMNGYGQIVTAEGVTDAQRVTHASADIFRVLRFSTAIGHVWTADDEARDMRVAVLGYRFWRERFGGESEALGKTVTIDNRQFAVIGVLAESTDHPESVPTSAPIWVPNVVRRGSSEVMFGGIIARMRSGVSTEQVAGEVQRIANVSEWKPEVRPLLDGYITDVRRWMLLALSAAVLVVLVACANAANLMLTRSVVRTQEMAIRASLGASRRQIGATVLVEGVLLAIGATVCGLILSMAGVRLAKLALLSALPGTFRATTISLNGRVMGAAIICAVVTGVLCALVPAWQTSRAPVSLLLKDSDAPTTTGRRRWRSLFLVAEVSTVTVLLVVTWLFVFSFVRSASVDLGLDTANLLSVQPRIEFRTDVADAVQRLQSVPGVAGVSTTRGAGLPIFGRAFGAAWATTKIRSNGQPEAAPAAAPLKALVYRVTPNYFDVAGLPFRRGAGWASDTIEGSSVVVIDEQAAKRLFGNGEAIGRTITSTQPAGIFAVVGVVPQVHTYGAEEVAQPSVYVPLPDAPARRFADLLIRTSRPAREMLPIVTQAMAPIAPASNEPIVFAADDAIARLTALRRFNAALMSVFGLAGALIGAAGIYAVMASFVAQQTREFGVRLALGATPGHIQRGVLNLAWRHMLLGLVVGVPVAWWLSRGLDALLFQVTSADLSVYAGVAALLSLVGVLAAWLPARRASRIDPILSLRR